MDTGRKKGSWQAKVSMRLGDIKSNKNTPESIQQTNVNKEKQKSICWTKTFKMCSKYAKMIPLKKI